MSLALLDCPTGLAGNMLLAALLDLGLPIAAIEEPLARLGLEGRYRLEIGLYDANTPGLPRPGASIVIPYHR